MGSSRRWIPASDEPVMQGRFRVYFNNHAAAPRVWCISNANAEGDNHWELAVLGVHIEAPANAIYSPKGTPDHEDGKPSAWLEVTGVLRLRGGMAVITVST